MKNSKRIDQILRMFYGNETGTGQTDSKLQELEADTQQFRKLTGRTKKHSMTLEDFHPGNNVNVKHLEGDMFEHDFTGHVKEVNAEYVVVEDQDGDCWDCKPFQLSFSSDDIMHG